MSRSCGSDDRAAPPPSLSRRSTSGRREIPFRDSVRRAARAGGTADARDDTRAAGLERRRARRAARGDRPAARPPPARCNDVLQLASVVGREFRLEQLPGYRHCRRTSSSGCRGGARRARRRGTAREPRLLTASPMRSSRRPSRGELSTTRRVRLHAGSRQLSSTLRRAGRSHAAELAYHFAEAETVLGPEEARSTTRVSRASRPLPPTPTTMRLRTSSARSPRGWAALDGRRDSRAARRARPLRVSRPPASTTSVKRWSTCGRRSTTTSPAGDTRRAVELAAYPIRRFGGRPVCRSSWSGRSRWSRRTQSTPAHPGQRRLVPRDERRRLRRGQGAFERALDIARRRGDAALERRSLTLAARVDWWHSRWEACVSRRVRGLSSSPELPTTSRPSCTRSLAGAGRGDPRQPAEAREHAGVALETGG